MKITNFFDVMLCIQYKCAPFFFKYLKDRNSQCLIYSVMEELRCTIQVHVHF